MLRIRVTVRMANQTARPSLARVSRILGAGTGSSLCQATCASFFGPVDAFRPWFESLTWVCLRRLNPPLRRPYVGAWASYPVAVLEEMVWELLGRREAWAMAEVWVIARQVGRLAAQRVALSKRCVVAAAPQPQVALHVRVRVGAPGARYAQLNVLPLMSEPGRAVSRATCRDPAKKMCAHEPAEPGAAARPILPGVE